jgi:16S rRNA (guanine527-N7)-methyltransferase
MAARLSARLDAHSIAVQPDVLDGCVEYLRLLARWNRRINLTALPLDPVPDSSLDKLIVEPFCALDMFPPGALAWVDLGSGGGSPALPLRLAVPGGQLTLIEARARKCAFLREAIRVLGIRDTDVQGVRFEDFRPEVPVRLVTVRAVRIDAELADLLASWLSPDGRIISFGATLSSDSFEPLNERHLPDGSRALEYRRR